MEILLIIIISISINLSYIKEKILDVGIIVYKKFNIDLLNIKNKQYDVVVVDGEP